MCKLSLRDVRLRHPSKLTRPLSEEFGFETNLIKNLFFTAPMCERKNHNHEGTQKTVKMQKVEMGQVKANEYKPKIR